MSLERYANTPTPSSPSTPWTTLNGAIDNAVTSITVTSFSPFPSAAQFRIVIDDEVMLVTAGAGSTSWTVTRGAEGSTPASHSDGASIFHVLTAASVLNNPLAMTTAGDMPYLAPTTLAQARLAIGANGSILGAAAGIPAWSAAGTTGQALISGGTGVPTWFAPTAGSILFAGASGILAQDNANLFYDDATNFLGLGTAAPGTLFDIVTQSNGVLRFTNYSTATTASTLTLRKARGTLASALRAKSADQLLVINATGASAVDDVTPTTTFGVGAQIRVFADADFTASTRPATLYFNTTPAGSTSATHQLALDSTKTLTWTPDTSVSGSALAYLTTANHPSHGTGPNQTFLVLVAGVDTTGTPSYYGNPILQFRLNNATSGVKQLTEIGVEGDWNTSSVLGTTTHWYVWDPVNSRTVLSHRYTAGSALNVSDLGLQVMGVSDASVIESTQLALTKNNSTTATYFGMLVQPTLNTGASNANTTVKLFAIDSINTTVTGLTVLPLTISYGGTELARINSTGQLGLGITNPTQVLHVVAQPGTNTQVNIDNYSANATGPSIRGRKARGTLADPRRVNTNDVIFGVNGTGFFAADDSTTASAGGDVAQFRFRATGNYTSTDQGSYFELRVTPSGSLAASIVTVLSITSTTMTHADALDMAFGTTTGTKFGTSTSQKLSFYNATPVVQQTDGANLTNNVTSGGTTDTIANFTDLTTYANDSAAIRNDIYQLARKVKIIGDALRTYGLLS